MGALYFINISIVYVNFYPQNFVCLKIQFCLTEKQSEAYDNVYF